MEKEMSIKEFFIKHLLGNYTSDDLASFIGGGTLATVFSATYVSHILDVAVVGFVGGACGLVGKILIQFIYDKYIKRKLNKK